MCDIQLEGWGAATLIRPCTPEGDAWIENHVDAEPWQWFGGAVAAEPALAVDVLDGARAAGLTVEIR